MTSESNDWPPPRPAPTQLPNRLGGLHATGLVLAWLLGPPIAFRIGLLSELGVDAPGLAAPDPLSFVPSACYFWFWTLMRFGWVLGLAAAAWFLMAIRSPERWRKWWKWRLQRDHADEFIAELATPLRTAMATLGTAVWIMLILAYALYQSNKQSRIPMQVAAGAVVAIAYPVHRLYHRLIPGHIVREARLALTLACATICFLFFGVSEAHEFRGCGEQQDSVASAVVGIRVGSFTPVGAGEQFAGMLLDTTDGVHVVWTGQRLLVIPVESVGFATARSSAEVDCVDGAWELAPQG